VFLGVAFLFGLIHLVLRSLRVIRYERPTTADKALTVGLLTLLLPLAFSSVFLNAMPIYLLLIMALARDSRRQPVAIGGEEGQLHEDFS